MSKGALLVLGKQILSIEAKVTLTGFLRLGQAFSNGADQACAQAGGAKRITPLNHEIQIDIDSSLDGAEIVELDFFDAFLHG